MKRERGKRRVFKTKATVLVRCVGCQKKRRISAGEIAPGEVPLCPDDMMPMVPVTATIIL
jgi:hypothetical protein